MLYLAGVALHQQPMDSRSHDCSSYVGCGGISCSILVSPNASLHKWQQAVAPGWLPYMVPQNWISGPHTHAHFNTDKLASWFFLKGTQCDSSVQVMIERQFEFKYSNARGKELRISARKPCRKDSGRKG